MLSRRTLLAGAGVRALAGQMFADAEAYEKFMGRWSSLLAPMLARFAALPDDGRVLDVGSGTGALAFAIAKEKPRCQVTGIDPSREYTGYAQSRNPDPKRIAFEVGDAQKLRFEDASFRACASLLVFNFIPDARKALGEVRRVTQPGGTISAAVWDYGAGMQMLRTYWDAVSAVDPAAAKLDESHMPLCRSGELTALWKEAGLKQVTEQPLEITMRFASFADYWEPFLLGQGPAGAYAKKLDATRREKLRQDLMRRLAVSSESAALSMGARAWAVRGTV